MRLQAAVAVQRTDATKGFKRTAWNAGAQANYVQICLNPAKPNLSNPLLPALNIFGPEYAAEGTRYYPSQEDFDADDWSVVIAPV
jgi:hypothetical protein